MNAPEVAKVHAGAMISVALIAPSKTNPRKTFTKAALDELTDSVRQHGVLQPVLVRPIGADNYELVAGERRYRAAKAADLLEIPAMIRELTDAQALELQVIENLQREDLHELEEAEGYEQLMKLHNYTAEDLAAKVGKSKAYVYARLKLCALVPAVRKMFFEGKLSASTALLIARIPVPDLQEKAAKDVVNGRYNGGDPMSYRDASEHLQRTYMLRLADAPFKPSDTMLLAKVGACGPCPKRTGNQPELFGDVKGADVCTDTVCFNAKREAHFKWVRAEAEAAGKKIISGKEAKQIFPYGHSSGAQNGYHSPERHNYEDAKNRTFGQLAKLAGVEPVLVEEPGTKDLVQVFPESAMRTALKKAGILTSGASESKKKSNDSERREREKQKAETTLRGRIFESLRGRLTLEPNVTTEDGVLVALTLWDRADFSAKKKLVDLYGWNEQPAADAKKKLRTQNDWDQVLAAEGRIAALTAPELWRLMIELAVVEQITMLPRGGSPDPLCLTAKRHGVDVDQLRKDAAAVSKAKEKPKAKAKPKKTDAKKPAVKKIKRAAAADLEPEVAS